PRAVLPAGRAPPGVGPGAGRPVPGRRDVLPGEELREGGAGVRDVRDALPGPPDRRPRAVPPGPQLLRPDADARAGPGDHVPRAGRVPEADPAVPREPLR